MYSARELELEDRQSRLESQLRERIASEGNSSPARSLICDSAANIPLLFTYCCFVFTCVIWQELARL